MLKFDVKGYYPNMRHDKAKECMEKHLSSETVKNAEKWLKRQYPYDVGYEPGSQMVQILGISFFRQVRPHDKRKTGSKNLY